ncbi:Type I phosphodiesterase / nucleotide pyrophosphatase [Actinomadura rubteroloni]|uniref:Type I phosphodiesterase / nucleotide pyrophosphatase n=1 Tax=Actinomadura rubteroloni TaxID=1926885 RepID=A0A2P4UCG5_9ACTN|nr:nucleotide pyrophosphatase/phosphodiesterase family protein [Actinomadura rubteroloni]POM22736.1 Type I phosphodiesterase / nucleotide pyrophosphatase [Actinomadura rubteroloni]
MTRPAPPVPAYGRAALADLPESALAALGVPGAVNVLGLQETRRICVLLVDGLGWEQLRAHPGDAPFLTSLGGGPLTAGFPATTVTSLGSLGTGLPPGGHGLLGLQIALPGRDALVNLLRWPADGADPFVVQPAPTVYERARAAGVAASYVGASLYRDSPLTRATARGADYTGADALGQLVAAAQRALSAGDRAYTTVYHPDLDSTGHRFGVASADWRQQLRFVDLLAERLADALPSGTALYVTADHGMTDPSGRIDADTDPALSAGVARLGGDARSRYVYALPGAHGDVLAAWRERLAGTCWVRSRAEAVAEGWFGPITPEMAGRVGDVVAVPHADVAITASAREPWLAAMVGMHGSLVAAEQLVPLVRTVKG